MTFVNVHIPSSEDLRQQWNRERDEREIAFLQARVDELLRMLENIYECAQQTGHVELWHRGDKLDLYTKAPKAKAE